MGLGPRPATNPQPALHQFSLPIRLSNRPAPTAQAVGWRSARGFRVGTGGQTGRWPRAVTRLRQRHWGDAGRHLDVAEGLMPEDDVSWCGRLGVIAAEVPGQEERAERLLREGSRGDDPAILLSLAVFIEPRDPYEAAEYISRARRE